MLTRRKRVERLGALYRRMEQMREMDLHRAASAVGASVLRQQEERAEDHAEASLGRTALAAGDRQEWMLAEAGRELIGLRMLRHREVQLRLEHEREVATEVYARSRLQRDQMERLASGQRRTAEAIEDRRNQAASDDRFLSRRAWLAGRCLAEQDEAAKSSLPA